MRDLVLLYEGQPLATSLTAGPICRVILDYPDECAESFRVWSVPRDGAMAPAFDATVQFAETWGMGIGFGGGIEPQDYLAGFPAFVVRHARAALIARWQAHIAALPSQPHQIKEDAA